MITEQLRSQLVLALPAVSDGEGLPVLPPFRKQPQTAPPLEDVPDIGSACNRTNRSVRSCGRSAGSSITTPTSGLGAPPRPPRRTSMTINYDAPQSEPPHALLLGVAAHSGHGDGPATVPQPS